AMHELGHNLGLLHGGPDCYNNKPNYISMMNYRYYTGGIEVAASPGSVTPISCAVESDCPAGTHCNTLTNACARVDYSDRDIALDETKLDESAGLQGGVNDTDIAWRHIVRPRTGYVRVPTNGSPIDWNNNGIIEIGVQFDVNGDTATNPMPGSNDWET